MILKILFYFIGDNDKMYLESGGISTWKLIIYLKINDTYLQPGRLMNLGHLIINLFVTLLHDGYKLQSADAKRAIN